MLCNPHIPCTVLAHSSMVSIGLLSSKHISFTALVHSAVILEDLCLTSILVAHHRKCWYYRTYLNQHIPCTLPGVYSCGVLILNINPNFPTYACQGQIPSYSTSISSFACQYNPCYTCGPKKSRQAIVNTLLCCTPITVNCVINHIDDH